MIRNLKDQTLKNAEQDWLKTNLARFSRMLQGERDLATISNLIMSELAPLVNAQYGVFYVAKDGEEDDATLDLSASYGAGNPAEMKPRFVLREGLIGQAAADKTPIRLVAGKFGEAHNIVLGHCMFLGYDLLPDNEFFKILAHMN
jgi:hypothetical protein